MLLFWCPVVVLVEINALRKGQASFSLSTWRRMLLFCTHLLDLRSWKERTRCKHILIEMLSWYRGKKEDNATPYLSNCVHETRICSVINIQDAFEERSGWEVMRSMFFFSFSLGRSLP